MTEPSPGKSKRPRPLVVDVHVPAESHSYPVLIGRGTIARLGTELQQRLGHTGTVALVSDTTVAPLHANNAVTSAVAAMGVWVAADQLSANATRMRRDRETLLAGAFGAAS